MAATLCLYFLLLRPASAGRIATAGQIDLQCGAIPNASRIPCGIYETRRANMHGPYDFGAACRSRGCCYAELPPGVEAGATPNCYWSGAAVPIKTAHLIQSNHFDAGFTGQLDLVVNSYFDTFFGGASPGR